MASGGYASGQAGVPMPAADIFATAGMVELRPGRQVRLFHHKAAGDVKACMLFCHGSMASMIQYRSNIEYAMSRGDLDVLAYDWLGCGGSEKPRDWDAYSTPNLLEDLEAAYCRLIKDLPKGTPAIVVGHSFGTSLVTQFAAESRSAVAADIFESTDEGGSALLPPPTALCLMAPCFGESGDAALAVFRLPEFALVALQPSMTAAFAKGALHPDTSEAVRRETLAVSEANEMHVCKAFYRQLCWREEEAAKCSGPALCISGDSDGLVSVESARKAAGQHEEVAFHVIAAASHQVMAEQPAATNALLATLIDNVIARRDPLQSLDRL